MKSRTESIAVTDDYFDWVKRFPLVPIRDARHLKEAHAIIDELSIIGEDSLTDGQAAYLTVLGDLTSAYESPAIAELTKDLAGLDVLKHLVESNTLTASDIGRIIGQRELGVKIMNGSRQISKENAKLLGE